jgi:hypothetical protein
MKESTKLLEKIRELKRKFIELQDYELAAIARDMKIIYEKRIKK